MRRHLSIATVPTIALIGLAAVPAVGSAATIAPSARCVASALVDGRNIYEPMTGTITGGTPGGLFVISGKNGEASNFSGQFDGAGNASYSIANYVLAGNGIRPSAGETVTLEVSEPVNGSSAITGRTTIKKSISALDYDLGPRRVGAKREVSASGTAYAGKRLYVFVASGSSRTAIRRVTLGIGNVCGYAKRKVALFNSDNPRNGKYRIYVSTKKKFSKNSQYRTVRIS